MAERAGPYRVLVTGSRDWADIAAIEAAFDQIAARRPWARQIVIVHGRCNPRLAAGRRAAAIQWDVALRMPEDKQLALLGADWLADRLAARRGWEREAHPADWAAYGPRRAGFVRNAEMTRTRLDEGLALLGRCTRCAYPGVHPSHGAAQCLRLATAAGVPMTPVLR